MCAAEVVVVADFPLLNVMPASRIPLTNLILFSAPAVFSSATCEAPPLLTTTSSNSGVLAAVDGENNFDLGTKLLVHGVLTRRAQKDIPKLRSRGRRITGSWLRELPE